MKNYIKTALQPMIEWTGDLPMGLVSISPADKENGSPRDGDMIAVNPKDSTDMWLIDRDFFEANYIEADRSVCGNV